MIEGSKNKEYRLRLALIPLLLGMIALGLNLVLKHKGGAWSWEYEPLHSVMETFGTVTGILMALVLLQREDEGKNQGQGLFWVALGFLSMGLLDGFHAVIHVANRFIFFRSMASLVGGFLFTMVWLPYPVTNLCVSKKKVILWVLIILSFLLGFYTFLFPKTLPEMIHNGEFTSTAKLMNFYAGILFLIASVYFILDFYRSGHMESYLFIYLTIFLGLARLLFYHATIWNIEWWSWHFLRLGAYLLTLRFVIYRYLYTIEEINQYRSHLEDLVKERTKEIMIANNQLKAEIADKIRTQEDLDRFAYQNKLILDSVGEGIYGIDLLGNTTFVNRAAIKITGYEAKELVGRHQHEILHHSKSDGSFYPPEECPIYDTIKRGLTRHVFNEVFWKKNGSSFPVEYMSTPIEEKGKIIGAVVAFKDITEQKRVEEEKAKIQAQLLQAQRMESIGILAGGVAHDFNNLLTTIIGYASLAFKKAGQTNPLSKDLEQISLAAGRAANLTRQLLLFSRKQLMETTYLDPNRVIENLLKMLHRLIGEDISINTELEPDIWPIRADEGNIEQVIMNLVVNARDAMPKGGEITIKTENISLDKDSLAYNMTEGRPGRFVRLSIADRGSGMDKETLSRIFEPFFSTKGLGKGTGLGLSVVYGIIKQHEGWINVYSEPKHGSIFKIYLPAFAIKLENKTQPIIQLEGFQGQGERILLVEDEEDVCKMMVKVLHENGYKVLAAANGQAALDIFEQEKGRFKLVISDVVLPDRTGPEVIDLLLLRQPELLVLLVSGYTDYKSQWSIIQKKGFRFLQKPMALSDLLKTLRELIEARK